MSAEPIAAWDGRVLVAGESAFGTVPNPAAAQGIEFISIDTGAMELGEVRPRKDRNSGRGMTSSYVVGRVKPMPWSLETSIKSRATNNTTAAEAALYRAAGLGVNDTGSSIIYSFSGAPLVDAFLVPVSIYRALGIGTNSSSSRYYAEQLRGGVVKNIQWSGGDRELIAKFSGDAIGKYHLGFSSSVTLADGSGTSLVFANAEEGYRFGLGWYQIESEIIKVTAMNYSTFTATIARAQLSSTGAAHAAKPMVPYLPSLTYAGNPIAETTCTVTIDSQSIRFTSFVIDFNTGIELGPGETGSAYVQTPIAKRCSAKVTLKGMMRREDVALLGKANQKATPLACTIVCGTGAGSIVTFSLPYCELDAMAVPDNANDMAMWSISLRTRDSATGNDLFGFTLT